MATLQRGDNAKSRDEGLIEIYKRQKPGEPPTRESAQSLFNSLFFDPKRYDLMRVGRYKFNKKLSLATRIQGNRWRTPTSSIPATGEVLVRTPARRSAGKRPARSRTPASTPCDVRPARAAACTAWWATTSWTPPATCPLTPRRRASRRTVDSAHALMEIMDDCVEAETSCMRSRAGQRVARPGAQAHHRGRYPGFHQLPATAWPYGVGTTDDIDHLGNRRLRSRGRAAAEPVPHRLLPHGAGDPRAHDHSGSGRSCTPQSLINIRPVTAAIKEFFGSSPLSASSWTRTTLWPS